MEIDRKDSSTPNFDTSNQTVGSFGNRLKQARIDKNLSLDDVAAELFILRRHLEAIEAEDFKELPQAAFARGFVINYAKFLNLDPDQIAESFNRNYPEELKKKNVVDIESPLKPMGKLQREGRRSFRINPLLLLGLIGLIILAIFLIRTVSNASDTAESEQDNTNVVDDLSESEQSAGAAINTSVIGDSNRSGSALDSSGSALDLNNDTAANNEATPVNANSSEEASLEFWIKGNTQLNVVDATGKTLLTGEQSRGGYKLSGIAPFKIKINNVSNVSMNLNKQPINLTEFAENNQASFSLSP